MVVSSTEKNVERLYSVLDYKDSPSLKRFDSPKWDQMDQSFVHLFERAFESCNLKGVYSCQAPNRSADSVPIVYICEAENENRAKEIHKQVWNQNIVPFLLVVSPDTIRLYNGFGFDKRNPIPFKDIHSKEGISWEEIENQLSFLARQSLDAGEVWQSKEWLEGPFQKTSRLDAHLLKNLKSLGKVLTENDLDRENAHGLIGKYIYLQYMRHRDFLSDERLQKWGIKPDDVFTRNATLAAFNKLDNILHEELNGTVFPMPAKSKIKKQHIEKVAAAFYGDDSETGQGVLFQLYDFSFIPTELLSTIYENFLHTTEQGQTDGAYYTPLPLINFVLNELEQKKPLTEGTTILDPACGSGAFLVQSYRRLVRKKYPKKNYEPEVLKTLLTDHIFGIDINPDACRVAQLGLLLTLLDHLQPRSLFGEKKFRLPELNDNIIKADSFGLSVERLNDFEKKFDWIVGNPPWMPLGKTSPAAKWCNAKPDERPTSNSLAEAFVWRSLDFAKNDAVIGLLLPSMTLFNIKSGESLFRRRFFSICDVWTIANFANMRKMLFPGAKAPGAAFFFKPTPTDSPDASILTYAPILVEQAINRGEHKKDGAWNIIVNSSEIRYVPVSEAKSGDPLVWKTAMWGSHRDLKFLRRVAKKFPGFGSFSIQHKIMAHAGTELREAGGDGIIPAPEIEGICRLVMSRLKGCGRIFIFPPEALEKIPRKMCYLRKRGGTKGIDVCMPPLVILDEARRFAVYSDQTIAAPHGQIGVAGKDSKILKALALYWNSGFFKYHQFFYAPQWGIRTDVAVLETLNNLPIPLNSIDEREIICWANLYDRLQKNSEATIFSSKMQDDLLAEANRRINKALGLRPSEVLLINDFLNYRMKFVDGRIPKDLLEPCSKKQQALYVKQLKEELDCFFDDEDGIYHDVMPITVKGPMEAVRIDVVFPGQKTKNKAKEIEIPDSIFDQLRRQHSQWLYFRRNLRIFDGNSIYLFKPKECYHWTESQALHDADGILAEILSMRGGKE